MNSIRELLGDPDEVGSAAYRAVYELLCDLEPDDGDDLLYLALAECDEIAAQAATTRSRLLSFLPTSTWALPQLPADWVTEHEGKLWIVPARANGWSSKRPYGGWHPTRIPTAAKVAECRLISTGIPTNAPAKPENPKP